jgi:anti-sigma regulatory factor (Ser/Thr protein kinase)
VNAASALTTGAGFALRHAALDLAPLDSAVPSARLHARLVLIGWGHARLARDGELIVSELVTNGSRFARRAPAPTGAPPPVRLRLTERPRGVLIEVWDAHDAMPEPRAAGSEPDAEGGRGLALVAAYAARWGAYPTRGGGKVTWAEVRATLAACVSPPSP